MEELPVRPAACRQLWQSSPCDKSSGLKVDVHHISESGGQHGGGTIWAREGLGAMEEGDGGKQEENMEKLG